MEHTVEIRTSYLGSIDPWTADYAKENNVSMMGTDDIRKYALIDGESVYEYVGKLSEFKKRIDNKVTCELLSDAVELSKDILKKLKSQE